MNKIFLALGSNLGNKEDNLKQAIKSLAEKIKDIKVAAFYSTKPMYFTDQPDFLNTVISGDTNLAPLELLQFTKQIESQLGRVKRFKNSPREIDIDILFYNDLIYQDENLIIPHPLIHERLFVLEPMLDLDPDFTHPVFKKTIKELSSSI